MTKEQRIIGILTVVVLIFAFGIKVGVHVEKRRPSLPADLEVPAAAPKGDFACEWVPNGHRLEIVKVKDVKPLLR